MRGNDIAIAGTIFPRGKDEDHLDLRFSAGGTAFISFNVSCWSHKDKQTEENQYISYTCVAFNELAEHIAESCQPKDTVVVMGRMQSNNWETDDGTKRYDTQLVVDEFGVSLRWGVATIQRTERQDHQPSKGPKGRDTYGADEAPF